MAANSIRETLREYATSAGRKLTVKGNVIEGVKLLGLKSRNGREYLADGVRKAATLYEGAKVNIDHGNKGESRSYAHRFGTVKAVRFVEGDGLYGDFVFNPKHPLAEQLTWDAENAPQSVGFSHVAEGKTRRDGGKTIVEEILSVSSVDLVADPATTNGLFENMDMDPTTDPAAGGGDMTWQMFVQKAESLFNGAGDPASKAKSIAALAKTLLKVQDDLDNADKPPETKPDEGSDPVTNEAIKRLADENKLLKERLDRADAEKKVRSELKAAGLSETDIPPALFDTLVEAKDDRRKPLIEREKQLAEERKQAARFSKPISRGQESFTESFKADSIKTTDDFLAAVT